jgi:hypothetical protein
MATTRPDWRVRPFLLAGAVCWPCLHAFAQTVEPASETASAPKPATLIQPTVDLLLTATNNANGTTSTAPARKDVILSTSAGLIVNTQGANAHAEGQWRLTSVKYARSTQPSRVLPSGQIDLHADLYRKEAGVDASVSSEQLALTPGTQPDAANTLDTTTNTRLSLSPFYTRQFDNDSSLLARLKRTWIHSETNSSQSSNAVNDNGTEDKHDIRWERRPARLGYALEATYSKSPVFSSAGSQQNNTSLTRRTATASLLYAVTPELVIGPILGHESSDAEGSSLSGVVRGADLRWQPNEHTQLKSVLKHSVFGKEWELDASRKTPWTTFGFNSRRSAETLAPQSTTASTTTTSASSFAAANTLGAVARETTSGRMNFIGRRDGINLSAGLSRTTPLIDGNALPPPKTKEYFFSAELIHKLTPLSNLTGGLRWTQGTTTSTITNVVTPSRDFTARLGFSTKLMSDTTATMGLKRQITHNASTTPTETTASESAVYIGLGHRF